MKSDIQLSSIPRSLRETFRLQDAMTAFAHTIVRDPDGRITVWTATDERIYGWTSREALGRVSHQLLRTELPEPLDVLERRAQTEGQWAGEIVHRSRDGRRHDLTTTWSPHYDEDGTLAAFIEVNCDATAQKAIEDELRARARDFRAFFHLKGIGSVLADVRDGRFLSVNQTFCELTGYSADELRHLSETDLTHPEDRERDGDGWRKAMARGDSHYTIEKRFVRKGGDVIWVSATSTIVRDDDGAPLRAAGVVIDATARREALAAIARARSDLDRRVAERTAAIEELSKRLETLIDASPVAVIALDHDQRVEIWNPGAEALLGLVETEAQGARLLDLPIEWNHPAALVAMLLASEARHANLRVRTRRGGSLDIAIWSAPYPGREGVPAGHVLLLLDETEKKFLEHAVLDAGEREQRRIGRELHDHLAQQLLGAAFGVRALNRELQSAASPSAERAEDLVRVINDSVVRARNMARRMNPIEIDSAGLMSALRELVERTPAGTQIELVCEREVLIHRSDVALHAFRIVQEAIANALRHARAHRIAVHLSETADGQVKVEVRDDGIGITEDSGSDCGIGIGIMKYRAQALHGELSIESVPGCGTTAACTFPNPV
ncbi:MAG: PAS domain S-box protein [Terrimicrobiaceae bacterium]|nr:PAS domain S-box protein [Terrimicrobiaceae bacterium]